MGKAPALVASEVDTLESEKGEFWTEGGKCGIDEERKKKDSLRSSGWFFMVSNTCMVSSDTPIS